MAVEEAIHKKKAALRTALSKSDSVITINSDNDPA